MKNLLLTSFSLLLLIVSSCKPEKENPSNCDLNSNNIIGTYKITGITYKENASTPIEDIFEYYEDCEKDDLLQINSNGTYREWDAGVKCASTYDEDGTWELSNDILTLDGSDDWTISSFDCTKVVITENGLDPGEVFTITLTKQ